MTFGRFADAGGWSAALVRAAANKKNWQKRINANREMRDISRLNFESGKKEGDSQANADQPFSLHYPLLIFSLGALRFGFGCSISTMPAISATRRSRCIIRALTVTLH